MAKKTSVIITDDIGGSGGAATVTFGYEGVHYEIDLSAKNRAKLEKAFAPYVEHGRRVVPVRRRASARPASPRIDRASIRAWAREQGLHVSERGRISAEVISQYEAVP